MSRTRAALLGGPVFFASWFVGAQVLWFALLASRATGQNAKHQSQTYPCYQVARGIPNRSANTDSKNYRSPKYRSPHDCTS